MAKERVKNEGIGETREARAGRVALVGRPNVGKSTLLNALVGQKLAIATPKPQTTRSCILGVYASKKPPMQIAFVDTPGMHRPVTALGRSIVEEAKAGLADVDVVVLVTDVPKALGPGSGPSVDEDDVLRALEDVHVPVVLALNKVDALRDKSKLLPLLAKWNERRKLAAIVPISATKGTNLDALVREIAEHLPPGVLYEDDFVTDRPLRFFAAELVREAVIARTRQEVPHSVAVVVEQVEEGARLVRVRASIVVDRPGHKGMIIGKGGAMLKEIGTAARLELEQLFERRVFLELHVRVEAAWTKDPEKIRRLTREAVT